MLAKRIIPCLDVKEGKVVKGVQFSNHVILGDVVELAQRYRDQGADELVFYDITASPELRVVALEWVNQVAQWLDIPFCVAGGIRSLSDAKRILNAGADKISINTPALENPELISLLAKEFGRQCVVVGVDSREENGDYFVYQNTGDPNKTQATKRRTLEWIAAVSELGAGEIVLNCMNQDGTRSGYDIAQLKLAVDQLNIPIIASGGAGSMAHFRDVFCQAQVDGALAASVFHTGAITIPALKEYLREHKIEVRYA